MAEYVPDQIRGHADECDGIEEYDNRLPGWWVGLFWFTIIWGVIVFVDWHVVSPTSLADQYDAEIAAAPQPVNLDEIAIVVDDTTAAAGRELYMTNCVACHGADATGEGLTGPSLIDDEWIHGSGEREILETIANGVLENGMPPWLPVLGPEGTANVTAYVLSLPGDG